MPAPVSSRFVGIDVSKAHLDVAILPDATTFQVANAATGGVGLLARLPDEGPVTIVLEATGSYHRGVPFALAGAGHPPAVINPRRTQAFLVSAGMRSKTDRSDARRLARFGQQKQPPPSPIDTQTARTRKDLVGCRDDFTKTLVMEKNRRTVASASGRALHETTIAFLTQQLARVDQPIAALLAADVELCVRAEVLRSVPGIGPVLLVRLPELGAAAPKALAALAGVAPYARDSGITRGARTIGGGRPAVCKALYQMAQTATRCHPVMRAHYQRRRQRLPHKPAVIACARRMLGILNAMLREGITWHETQVGQGQFLPDPA
jgi:transposase